MFQLEPSNFGRMWSLGPWYLINYLFFVLGPRLAPRAPPKCQNFKIAIFKLECSKLQSRLVMLTKNNIRGFLFVLGPRFGPNAPKYQVKVLDSGAQFVV